MSQASTYWDSLAPERLAEQEAKRAKQILAEHLDTVTPLTQTVGDMFVAKADIINHPPHYTKHPSGVECIDVTEHMNFCLGNAVKYIWRADMKGGIEDLKKAAWYIQREINRREGTHRGIE